jgi:hypothetical protein
MVPPVPTATVLGSFRDVGSFLKRCKDAAITWLIYDESLARNHTRIMEARPE